MTEHLLSDPGFEAHVLNVIVMCCCRFGRSNVLAELRPRFPLYGGWKAEFTFGYSLPLSAILTKVKGSNQLEASFSSPFDRVVVDDLTVKVASLPPNPACCA